jgi:hypothetical protein
MIIEYLMFIFTSSVLDRIIWPPLLDDVGTHSAWIRVEGGVLTRIK